MNIILDGQCTVERAEDLRNTLLQALEQEGTVEVSFSQVEDADISFFQLLHAVRLSGVSRGRTVVFHQDLPERLGFKARMAGLEQIVAA